MLLISFLTLGVKNVSYVLDQKNESITDFESSGRADHFEYGFMIHANQREI